MSRGLRKFSPARAAERLEEIEPSDLIGVGKKLVLLDVDNTLLPWHGIEVPEEVLDWLARGRAAGLRFCLVSNTRRVERLQALAESMQVDWVRARNKPSRQMYRQALERHSVGPEAAVMIGDQILTDVLGANRAGIDAIWVRPITGKEFVGTKLVSRWVERVVRLFLYRHMHTDQRPLRQQFYTYAGPLRHQVVRQFLKFCVVGGSSFVIDAGIHRALLYHATAGADPLYRVVGGALLGFFGQPNTDESAYLVGGGAFKVVSAALAILNSFIWNRSWTFGIRGKKDRTPQLVKFVIVSLIGLLLNTAVYSLVSGLASGYEHRWFLATFVAAGVVAIWNFTGQRKWALKRTPR